VSKIFSKPNVAVKFLLMSYATFKFNVAKAGVPSIVASSKLSTLSGD